MAVVGWTPQSSRSWTGAEATSIHPSDGTVTGACVLTRDANDLIGSDFTSEHYLVNNNDSSQLGGLTFCFTDNSNFYHVVLNTVPSNTIRLIKNETKYGASASNIIAESSCTDILQNCRIKVVKSGSNIKVYTSPNDNDTSYTLRIDVTDTTHSIGKIGYGYEGGVWSGTYTLFYYRNISGGVTPPTRRRIFLIT